MYQACIVGDVQGITQRLENRQHFNGRQPAALLKHLTQARSFDIFEDQVRSAIAKRSMPQPAYDIAVVQPLDGVELTLKSSQGVDRLHQLRM